MHKYFFLILFLGSQLSAALLDVEFYMGPGYRRDKLKYHNLNASESVTNQFHIHNINSVQEILNLNLVWGRARLEFEGDFGWVVTGRETVDFPSYQGNPPMSFSFGNLYGYEADGMGSFGYMFPLYDSQFFDLDIAPFVGFKYWHLATRVKSEEFSDTSASFGVPAFALYHEPVLNHGDFFGPYLEGRVVFYFHQIATFKLYYQYHFTYMRIKTEPSLNQYVSPTPTSVITSFDTWDAVIKDNHAHAQVGGVDLRFQTLSNVMVGGTIYGSWFYTKDAKTITNMNRQSLPLGNALFPNEETTFINKSKVHWNFFSFSLYAGYIF